MKYEYFKEHYQFEWQLRAQLISSMNMPTAVITVLGSVLGMMVQQFIYEKELLTYLFIFFCALAFGSILFAIFFMIKAIHGYKYKRIASPLVFQKYYIQLQDWHEKYGKDRADADQRFEEKYYLRIGEAVEINARNNEKKSDYLYKTNLYLVFTVLSIAIASLPFLIQKVTTDI